ncbi:MAG: cellulase N-terminal Ig-like domain-containing protein, partial [Opitutales bacterium]
MHLKPSLFAGRRFGRFAAGLCSVIVASTASLTAADLALNELEYLAMPGLNVMLAHDFYPESHQSGVSILQHGRRVATNGDLRLEPTPGQWQPVPKEIGEREVDPATGEIRVRMAFPDEARDRKGFNPILYPDLEFSYTVRVEPAGGSAFRIAVDLDEPLPAEWIGKVGFNLELFPGFLFGKTFLLDGVPGRFPRQANGPGSYDAEGAYQVDPLGVGRELVIAPAEAEQRLTISSRAGGPLELLDGRSEHHNGWYVVRSTIPDGATQAAVEWLVTPHVMEDWRREPVIQVSQVGYHPGQEKIAIIELDQRDAARPEVEVLRVGEDGARTVVAAGAGESFGRFLRYDYLQFDFSAVREPGLYEVRFGEQVSHPFLVASDIYQRHVWQPTVEYFLPVQMCHMQVNDRYRVWHGRCHLDDARMAPVNHNHFDGYLQGPETLTRFAPGEPVPGLNRGGWHDAGDYDLRVESQAGTMHGLALAYEEFGTDYDSTLVDQRNRLVEIHRPDGVPDLLQQIEHGALTVLGGYEALGRLYRGIIA